jgi:hypothetical protein
MELKLLNHKLQHFQQLEAHNLVLTEIPAQQHGIQVAVVEQAEMVLTLQRTAVSAEKIQFSGQVITGLAVVAVRVTAEMQEMAEVAAVVAAVPANTLLFL